MTASPQEIQDVLQQSPNITRELKKGELKNMKKQLSQNWEEKWAAKNQEIKDKDKEIKELNKNWEEKFEALEEELAERSLHGAFISRSQIQSLMDRVEYEENVPGTFFKLISDLKDLVNDAVGIERGEIVEDDEEVWLGAGVGMIWEENVLW